jgi:hypothetical protein
MKNTIDKNENELDDDMQVEYDFDFSKSKPNRFAKILKQHSNIIELEPDIQKVFRNSEEVNIALRALISAIPSHKKRKTQKVQE